MAKDLIDAGADLNAHRNDGFTPLHVAVKNNQPRMTDVLVKAMADLSAKEVPFLMYKVNTACGSKSCPPTTHPSQPHYSKR